MTLGILLAVTIDVMASELLNTIEMGDYCSTTLTCPHIQVLNMSYMGYGFSAAVFAAGLFLFLRAPVQGPARKPRNLDPDERKVFGILSDAGGMVFQSDLVEKTGFPKARVTRVLDRLEARKVLERRRRGMTNAVILK